MLTRSTNVANANPSSVFSFLVLWTKCSGFFGRPVSVKWPCLIKNMGPIFVQKLILGQKLFKKINLCSKSKHNPYKNPQKKTFKMQCLLSWLRILYINQHSLYYPMSMYLNHASISNRLLPMLLKYHFTASSNKKLVCKK